jgi:hypothetical protein
VDIDTLGFDGGLTPDLALGSAMAQGKALAAQQLKIGLKQALVNVKTNVTAAEAATAAAKNMITQPVNIDTAPIDRTPDVANSIGASLISDVAVNIPMPAGAGSITVAANGRMPFDPADPNVGSLIKPQNTAATINAAATPAAATPTGGTSMLSGNSGLILIVVVGWLIFRKKRA